MVPSSHVSALLYFNNFEWNRTTVPYISGPDKFYFKNKWRIADFKDNDGNGVIQLMLDYENYTVYFTESTESIREVSKHEWKRLRDDNSPIWYAHYKEKSKVVTMHRMLLDFPDRDVTHINRDGCDNTFPNILDASQKVIQRNTGGSRHNTSGHNNLHHDEKNHAWKWSIIYLGRYIQSGQCSYNPFERLSSQYVKNQMVEKYNKVADKYKNYNRREHPVTIEDPDYDIEKLDVEEIYKVRMRDAEKKYAEKQAKKQAKRKRAREEDAIPMLKPDFSDVNEHLDH
jgi:hypothetical protein